MTQDVTPIGPSSPPIGARDAAPGRSLARNPIMLFGCGGCAVVVVLATIFGGWALLRFGLGVFSGEVESELRSNPVITEHIGLIQEFEIDVGASFAAAGDEVFVFRVRGSKGSGLVTATCVTTDDGTENVVAGTLQLDSGETLNLFPGPEGIVEESEIMGEPG
jgi:hypothetical protein